MVVMKHPMHPEHPLTLLVANEDGGDEKACRCDGCLEVISNAYYGCSQCKFFLHKLCAELPQVMEHPMHPEHPLTLLKASYCVCTVCDNFWRDFAYICSAKCNFSVDIICASVMERKIDHPGHKHPLTPVRRTALLRCDACGQKHEGMWYQCTTCGQGTQSSIASPVIHVSNVTTKENESCPVKNFKNDGILCEACVKPVIAPFYKCSLCNFVLHKCCAELPTDLQHPFHPQHQLILLPKSPDLWGLFLCKGCDSFCNGFAFGCVDRDCDFYLDVSCGSLPSTIKHEAHMYTDHLLHFEERLSGSCSACDGEIGFEKRGFSCDHFLEIFWYLILKRRR
ncbi:hypothetical protein RJ639_042719 [Escallonia herrerae]|uniref:DC1 domain-containing protein n=1 Tax=Escallonia herrerae TaxID=1293975 RepID=A0AA88WBM3_9ASTE|nr:hypothetical protein RJ639_042719 [Escallonia herrerae]